MKSPDPTPNRLAQAFSHHPRIGGQRAGAVVSAVAADWSQGGQSATSRAVRTRAALAEAMPNTKGFGFIFIICANGRRSDEFSPRCGAVVNEPDAEIFIAARSSRSRVCVWETRFGKQDTRSRDHEQHHEYQHARPRHLLGKPAANVTVTLGRIDAHGVAVQLSTMSLTMMAV